MALWLCSGSKLPSTSLIIVLPVLVASGFFGAPSGTADSESAPIFVGDTDLPPMADPGREPGREELADPGLADVGRALTGLCECAEPGRDMADPGRPPEERTEVLLSSGCRPGWIPEVPPREGWFRGRVVVNWAHTGMKEESKAGELAVDGEKMRGGAALVRGRRYRRPPEAGSIISLTMAVSAVLVALLDGWPLVGRLVCEEFGREEEAGTRFFAGADVGRALSFLPALRLPMTCMAY
mmetsp:Transcript_21414/g.49681  ORF Transcript_21414/g.49681 Transcript_21414/m.49681 type:complete len:239 (-) Transcript_21414:417-1133(-)